jgi:hypothetical protein
MFYGALGRISQIRLEGLVSSVNSDVGSKPVVGLGVIEQKDSSIPLISLDPRLMQTVAFLCSDVSACDGTYVNIEDISIQQL